MTFAEFNEKWAGYGVELETVDVRSQKGGLQIYQLRDTDEGESLGFFETVEDADADMRPLEVTPAWVLMTQPVDWSDDAVEFLKEEM